MRTIRTIFMLLGVVILMIATSNAPATATTPEPTYITCVGVDYNVGADTCVDRVESQSSSQDEAKSMVTSVNGVKIKSNVTVLSYIKAQGMSTVEQKRAKSITLNSSGCFNTSYYNIALQEVWHNKCYSAGKKFFLGSDGYYHDPLCYNKVTGLPKGPKAPPRNHIQIKGQVKIVPRFKFSGQAYSKVHGMAVSKSVSWANLYNEHGQQTCHSEGRGNGSASYYAVGRARFSGRVFISIKQAVEALASGANTDLETQMGVKTTFEFIGKAWSKSYGMASAESSSSASCISHIPPEELTCPQVYGPGYTGEYPNCTKDGTSTPPPPPGTPGPNPPPADPGESYQCYSEETGEPVASNPDGTCPVGSWGN